MLAALAARLRLAARSSPPVPLAASCGSLVIVWALSLHIAAAGDPPCPGTSSAASCRLFRAVSALLAKRVQWHTIAAMINHQWRGPSMNASALLPIDIRTETLLSLPEAAKRCPSFRQGKPVSVSCVLRWILTGIKGLDGTPIRLEAIRLRGHWITSIEAIERFIARQTPDFARMQPPLRIRTAAQRRRDLERAAQELDRAGI